MLPTKPLGTTGMEVTRVGFGAAVIGGIYGKIDEDEAVVAVRRAVESGINWIDTASMYGKGKSEELVALALRDIPERDRPLVFSKGGIEWDVDDPAGPLRRVGTPASLKRHVEQSLSRLGLERLDLYYMHWPPQDETPVELYWQALLDLVTEGKIRAAALSNHDTAALGSAEAIDHVPVVQVPLSLINRNAIDAILPWATGHDTAVIVYWALQSGLLTGSFDRARVQALASDDWRSRDPNFQGESLERNLALANSLRSIAQSRGSSVSAVALAWVLANDGVTAAIAGTAKPDQIDGWLDGATLTLEMSELAQIAEALESTGAGIGPSRPYRAGM